MANALGRAPLRAAHNHTPCTAPPPDSYFTLHVNFAVLRAPPVPCPLVCALRGENCVATPSPACSQPGSHSAQLLQALQQLEWGAF